MIPTVPTKEDILGIMNEWVGASHDGWSVDVNGLEDASEELEKLFNDKSKEIAIGFFKWNGLKIFEYVTLLKENISSDKQKEIEEFELSSIEKRFNQYIQTLQP